MKRFIVVALLLACACQAAAPASDRANVERVVDGDTLIAIVDGARTRIRLIGVDTPETVAPDTPVQCYGPEASRFAKAELTGEAITLVYDRRRFDRYRRTLAYVYRARDGLFVNLELVRRGYARALDIPPDDRFAREFAVAERRARVEKLGLWGRCG